MVEDVIFTEAMIPGAAGAIPELKIWIVCIRTAADTALVMVSLFPCLFLLLFRGGSELDRLV